MVAPNWERFLNIAKIDEADWAVHVDQRIICTHQHRIDLAKAPGIRASQFSSWVKRDWPVEALRAASSRAGVGQRVLVAVVDPWDGDPQRRAENLGDVEADALTALCAAHADCMRCVVSVDYSLPEAQLSERLGVLAARPEVSGLRLIHTQATSASDQPFADPRFLSYCRLAAEHGLTIELLCREGLAHYPQVLELVAEFGGDWPIIINHGGNPAGLDGGGPSGEYRVFLDALARRGNVAIKSALDEWAPPSSPAELFFPYWDLMVETLGFEWLLFETNFPVSLDSGNYESAEEGFCDAIGRQLVWLYSRGYQEHLEDFLWQNAQRLYR